MCKMRPQRVGTRGRQAEATGQQVIATVPLNQQKENYFCTHFIGAYGSRRAEVKMLGISYMSSPVSIKLRLYCMCDVNMTNKIGLNRQISSETPKCAASP